jgi:hypothetical protein
MYDSVKVRGRLSQRDFCSNATQNPLSSLLELLPIVPSAVSSLAVVRVLNIVLREEMRSRDIHDPISRPCCSQVFCFSPRFVIGFLIQ